MARQLSDLTVQLSGAPLAFRWSENGGFLKGTQPYPRFYDQLPVDDIFVFALFSIGMILLGGIVAYIALWYSPLAVRTSAMIGEYREGEVSYHYFAGSNRYDKIEPASRFEPTWDSVEPTHPVVYLPFDQSNSRLDFNFPTLNPFLALAALSVSLFTFIKWHGMRNYKRMTVLRDEAAHLLEGRTFKVSNRLVPKSISCTYAFTSPKTGAEIRGYFWSSRSAPHHSHFQQGTVVAILYRDDKLHAVL